MFVWNHSSLFSLSAELAFKSFAIVSAGMLLALALRKASAARRHLTWAAVFIALLLLPALALLLPALRVPIKSPALGEGAAFRAIASSAVSAGSVSSSTRGQKAASSPLLPAAWPGMLVLLWIAVGALGLAQTFIAYVNMERSRRRARPLAFDDLPGLMRQVRVCDPVELRERSPGSMPVTFGLRRPVIFLPHDFSCWDEERQQFVLLHELAHIRRHDCLTHLLARLAVCLFWWNPLVWFAWRQLVNERERAADDLVLGAGARPSAYAAELLQIATGWQAHGPMAAAGVAFARRSQLELRLAAILDAGRNRALAQRGFAVAIMLLAIASVAPLAALHAQDAQPAPASVGSAASPGAQLLKQADAARDLGHWDEASAGYQQARAAFGSGPGAASAVIGSGTVELARKAYDQASADFEQAATLDREQAGEATMWRAIVSQKQGELPEAEAYFQTALAAMPPNSAISAACLDLQAQLLRKENRKTEADALHKQAETIRQTLTASQAQSDIPAAGPGVYRIGGTVSAPKLDSKIEPSYSEEARLAGYQGTILLSVIVGADGTIHQARVVRGLGFGLDQKAIAAVQQWKFTAASKNGEPVAVQATVEVNFQLL